MGYENPGRGGPFQGVEGKISPERALDGDLVYESIIPGQEELIEEIKRRYREK